MDVQEIDLNSMYEKLYKIPKEKLVEINDFIDSILRQKSKVIEGEDDKNKILSFAGMWKEMKRDEFANLMKEIKGRRRKTFSRRRNETRFG